MSYIGVKPSTKLCESIHRCRICGVVISKEFGIWCPICVKKYRSSILNEKEE
mgnify:CR=1 FL=1